MKQHARKNLTVFKNTCQLNGECQAKHIIYKAILNSNKLNYDKNIARVVVKPLLKNNLPITK